MFFLRVLLLILFGSAAIDSAQADTIASFEFFFDSPGGTVQAPFISAGGESTLTFNYSLVENAPPGSYVSILLSDLLTFSLTGGADLVTAGSIPTTRTAFSIGLTDLTTFDYTVRNTGNLSYESIDLSFTANPVASSNPNFGPALMDIRYITHGDGADITFPQNVYGLSTPGVGAAFGGSFVLTPQPAPPAPVPEPSGVGSLLLSAAIFTCYGIARKPHSSAQIN